MKKHVTHSLGLATTVLCWGWCVVLAPLNARAAVTFTHDTVINLGDTTYDGQDIVIQACTVTVNGAHAFKGVQVTGGGVLTHSPTTPAQDFSLQLTITNTLLVDGSSAIDVSGRGYVNDASLGALTLGNTTAGAASGSSGGSYGGLGAGGQANVTYGDYRNPNELGSAGAEYRGEGGAGGGLVRISAASAQIDGQFLANGGNGVGSGYMFDRGGAGGSGGGIWLRVDSLSGSGVIAANGGNGVIAGCAGGGGRVAIYYGMVAGFDLTNRVTAHGANGNGTGSLGTVYLKPSGAPGELRLASHGAPVGLWTPLGVASNSVFQVENLVITGTNVVAAPVQQMPIQAGSVTVVSGAMLTHQPTTPAQDFSLQLTITNTLLVDGSSAIDVSGRGYVNDASLGALTLGNTTAGAASGSSGGSYGGLGAGGQANVTYGDYRNPNELGSAGAQGKGEGGAGGGLLRISAASAQIDGQLLANGGNAVDNGLMFNPGGAGGSGGGIWLNVGSLSGSGLIAANGGEPALQWGGGGGGGRVAVYYGAVNDFDLANRVTAHGANGNGTGSVGTVYLKPSGAPGELLLASHGTPTGVWTPLGTATDAVFQVENLVISGTNVVAAPAHQMPVQAGSVTVANGALLTHQPTTPAQEFSLRLTATNSLLVDSSSAIDVSGCGYVDDYTWGAFTLGNTTSGAAVGRSGGSYGGLGGAADGIGAPYLSGQPNSTYGDPHNPNELGSAGAGLYGFGGAGGGLVRISAATAQIDGVLLANGANPAGDGGGGSGGGIWLNVGALSGSGRIAADGGTASYWGAAGGGGRVAIYAVQWNFPKAAIAAGVGTGGPAGAQSGTVLFGPTTRLSSSRAGPSLTFSWPALATGYRLESTANLANPVTWTPVTNSVTVLGEQNTVTVDLTGPTRFFRLNQ